MGVAGRKPKPEDQRINRNKPTYEWTEVPNIPHDGAVPELPETRRVVLPFGETKDLPLNPLTRQWWQRISRMPHCVLWTESDWEFALATALVADAFYYGHNASATELARREKILGVTFDSRRDLRIRYVEPPPEVDDAEVTRLDDYRVL